MKAKAIKLFLFSLIVFSAIFSNAQAKKNIEYSGFFDSYYFRGPWSVTAGAGLNFYNGDLATFFKGNKMSPTFNFGVAYKPWPRVRFGAQIGIMNFDVEDIVDTRSYTMKSSATELMFYGKYYLVEDIIRRHGQFRNDDLKPVKPFFSLGFAPVIYSSTITDTLNIETTNSGIALAVPVGAGILFDFTHRVSLSLDIAYRYVLSDQLDGYGEAQGGGSANDSYATVGLTVQYSPFAKRMHPKKFKAPKDAQEHHYGTGGEEGAPVEGGAPSSEDSVTPEGEATSPTEEVINPVETVEDETQDDAPADEQGTEEDTEGEDEYDEETEADDEYYEEDDSSDDSYDESYDDGW
jgi:hypothetical protein